MSLVVSTCPPRQRSTKVSWVQYVTVGAFNTMLKYCQQHHLARFTYWELNRDTGGLSFTKVIGKFQG